MHDCHVGSVWTEPMEVVKSRVPLNTVFEHQILRLHSKCYALSKDEPTITRRTR